MRVFFGCRNRLAHYRNAGFCFCILAVGTINISQKKSSPASRNTNLMLEQFCMFQKFHFLIGDSTSNGYESSCRFHARDVVLSLGTTNCCGGSIELNCFGRRTVQLLLYSQHSANKGSVTQCMHAVLMRMMRRNVQ